LRNTSYIGTYTRFGLRLTKNHEPLIETELFRSAQDKVRERRRYRGFANSLPYLLSGLCICGYCGNGLMGVNRKQTWKRQDGTRMRADYRYYQCQSRANKGTCGYHTWPTEKLEERVLTLIKEALESGSLQESMVGPSGEEKRRQAATKRLRKVEAAEKRFIEFMRKTSRGQSVVPRLSLYINNLDLARTQAFISVDVRNVHNLVGNWETKSFAEQQSFLDEYLTSITVKDRSVRIHY
ncbi:MAG: zinc ribbon domain-containing protein, partial [Chloroflexota bacterium]|nr:zinc ribbon domain-containing protein [Chloroflexota bacterium]